MDADGGRSRSDGQQPRVNTEHFYVSVFQPVNTRPGHQRWNKLLLNSHMVFIKVVIYLNATPSHFLASIFNVTNDRKSANHLQPY